MTFTPQENNDFARAESRWLTPPDVAELPQPKDKCDCGHIADDHHGVAMLCWKPNCDCGGFVTPGKARDRFFYEDLKNNGAD